MDEAKPPAAFFSGCRLCLFVMFCVLLWPLRGDAGQTATVEVVERFNGALMESMKGARELGFSGRSKLLQPVVDSTFDLSFMARVSMGSHWRELSGEQRSAYIEKYREWTVAAYAGRFDSYSGERFEVVSESGPVRGTVTVISRLVKPGGKEVDFHYLLRERKGWRIVDIRISGVSQLALTRSQFVSVMEKDGFEELLSLLQEKIEGFRQEG